MRKQRLGRVFARPVHANIENLADRAASYGMPGVIVQNDVVEIYEACGEAVDRAGEGLGPR